MIKRYKVLHDKRIAFIVLLLALTIAFIIAKRKHNLLINDVSRRFTIGITKRRLVGKYGYGTQEYQFKVEDKLYKGSRNEENGIKVPEGKYLVVYYEKNPDINFMIYREMDEYQLGDDVTDILEESYKRNLNIPWWHLE